MTRASDTARLLSGGAVINEDSNDVDFRVESNGNTHALFVDGGNDGVGIGTSSVDTNATMTISNTGDNHALSIVGAVNKSRIHFQGANTGSSATDGLVIGLSSSDDTNDDSALIGLKENGSMSFQTNNNTRMTIDSNGRVGIGTSPNTGRRLVTAWDTAGAFGFEVDVSPTSGNIFGQSIFFSGNAPDSSASEFLRCRDTSTSRLKIFSDGDVQNHDNSYSALSDIKLKEQITDASSQWEDIKALTIRKFKFKTDVATGDSDAHWRLGVIAQEVETAGMNGLVKTNSDTEEGENGQLIDTGTTTKSVKYSILYMKAVKALQEAMTRIETLEAKVTALENA